MHKQIMDYKYKLVRMVDMLSLCSGNIMPKMQDFSFQIIQSRIEITHLKSIFLPIRSCRAIHKTHTYKHTFWPGYD